ncbi:MAG TPA: very short patch repair endonuclease [Planctomycetaceae bacterium]|nr:very short patch repair endonuclease [Planctomycetaceae bacterium]
MTDTLTPKHRSEQMSRVRSRDTAPELAVRRFLHSCGFRYRLHVQALPGCPDLVFPRLRKVLFVHGCFWHQHSCRRGNRVPKSHRAYWQHKLNANRERDKKHRLALRRLGWEVLTVWECQITRSNLLKLQKQLGGKS